MKQTKQTRPAFNFFPANVPVLTLVVLGVGEQGRVEVKRKFRLANSVHDLAKFPLDEAGQPVIGPRVYRERTKAEIKSAGLAGQDYLATLVPVGNTGKPWFDPASVVVPAVASVAA